MHGTELAPASGRTATIAGLLRAAPFVVLVLACLTQARFGYCANDISGHAVGSDDAYVTYRYARNLVEGHGLVMNPGERIEGFSNLLYAFLIAPGILLLGARHVYIWSLTINIIATVSAVALVVGVIRDEFGTSSATAAAWTLALCPVVWMWTASGLETPVVLLLQVVFWSELSRSSARPIHLGRLVAAAIVAVLIRADGMTLPIIVSAYLAVRGDVRTALVLLVASVGVFAGLTGSRLAYYGDWLPSPYYVKVTSTLALRLDAAFHQFIRMAPHTGLLAQAFWTALAPLAVWIYWRRQHRGVEFAAFLSLAIGAYWFYIGGDLFDERFLLVVFPLGIYGTIVALHALDARRAVPAVLALSVVLQLAPLNRTEPRFWYTVDHYDHFLALGDYLREHHHGQTLAIDASGKVPYVSTLPIVDMLGFADRHIMHEPARVFSVAHSKFDPEYVLSRRPDLIASYLVNGTDMDRGLTQELYRPAGYELKYLVYAGRHTQPQNVVDVSELEPKRISALVATGWGYGVLTRRTMPVLVH